jgi:hypothetical protein
MVVSLYWPFRGELDLREWRAGVIERGVRVALPVVVAKAHPLIFREWRPGCRIERGVWNIPAPADGEVLTPDVVLAPLVGFDPDGTGSATAAAFSIARSRPFRRSRAPSASDKPWRRSRRSTRSPRTFRWTRS